MYIIQVFSNHFLNQVRSQHGAIEQRLVLIKSRSLACKGYGAISSQDFSIKLRVIKSVKHYLKFLKIYHFSKVC